MAKSMALSPEEISVFCGQIAMMLNGGIPIYEGVRILYDELDDGRTKSILEQVNDVVSTGRSLNEALEESGAFPEYVIEMVRIGEITGKLEDIMKSLSRYYERECAVKDSIRSVIGYPTVLLGMMAAILIVLVVKILPMFGDIFLELDGGTGETLALMNSSMITARVISVIVLVLLAVLISVLVWYTFKGSNSAMNSMLSNNIFLRNLAYKISVGKFFSALSVMSAAGMEMTEAVKNSNKVIENRTTKANIEKCIQLLETDHRVEDAMKESGLLDSVKAKMLGVARVSGADDVILTKFSIRFDEEIGTKLNSLASVIETALVVILSVVIGAILLSVMIPLMSVLSSIG